MAAYISYKTMFDDRKSFLKSGGYSSNDFNMFDTPGHKYFKLLFYFNNGDVAEWTDVRSSGGLLAPTWLLTDGELEESKLYKYESAWAYLKRNCEDERAELLKNFVNLLSNINSHSPWYFSEITGLETALERRGIMDGNLQFDEKRPKISIKCLQDSYDDRIGTLLDLYRSIVFSWTRKCEMVPANLRKFDMGIFVFETMAEPFHFFGSTDHQNITPMAGIDSGDINIDAYSKEEDKKNYSKTSYKYYELHNCEFDFNSTKSFASSMNNKDGFNPEYTIDIHFDDCYEVRYNEFLFRNIGDFIINDLATWDFGYVNQNDNYFGPPDTSAEDALKVKTNYIYKPTNEHDHVGKDYSNYFGTMPRMSNLKNRYPGYNANKGYESNKHKDYLDRRNRRDEEMGKQPTENIFEVDENKKGNLNNSASGNTTTDSSNKIGNLHPESSTDITYSNQSSKPKKTNPFVKAVTNAATQVVGTAYHYVSDKIKRALLGNLYTFSLTRLGDQLKAAANGDVWSTLRAVDEYTRDAKQRRGQVEFTDDNLFDNKPPRIIPSVKKMGNIAKGKSIANNI